MGAFMDAYFSNYIEGVRFDVLEAKGVIFDQAQLPGRSGDAADLAGTFQQLNNGHEPSPSNLVDAAFLDALRRCHGALMEGRQDMSPGVFKSSVNRAGNTTFVAPDLVEGTLREGLSILRSIADGFRRAMVLHYLLAEVHPFHDGNGRLARVLMNRELKAAGLSRIVVPTVFRDDYIAALRALSQRDDPSVIVRAMEFCQRVTAACVASTVTGVIQVWAQAYGFCEDGRAARLTMPSPALVVVERDGVNAPEGYWEDVSSAAFFRQ
jgi:hypothetical protein